MTLKRYVAVLIAIVAVSGLVFAQSAFTAKQPKTTICHKTKSAKKPYVKIKVAKSVLKGHLRHAGDIIPAPTGPCPTDVLTPDAGGTLLSTNLLGSNEVPGPGDADGAGTAQIRLRQGEGRVCFKIAVTNIVLPATGAHIHSGAVGVAGPIVVGLTPPGLNGMSEGCVTASRAVVNAILGAPASYYVNVHTTDFPNGAIRGQL
jgi:hypothetical protein